jgi:hypothetical protein
VHAGDPEDDLLPRVAVVQKPEDVVRHAVIADVVQGSAVVPVDRGRDVSFHGGVPVVQGEHVRDGAKNEWAIEDRGARLEERAGFFEGRAVRGAFGRRELHEVLELRAAMKCDVEAGHQVRVGGERRCEDVAKVPNGGFALEAGRLDVHAGDVESRMVGEAAHVARLGDAAPGPISEAVVEVGLAAPEAALEREHGETLALAEECDGALVRGVHVPGRVRRFAQGDDAGLADGEPKGKQVGVGVRRGRGGRRRDRGTGRRAGNGDEEREQGETRHGREERSTGRE